MKWPVELWALVIVLLTASATAAVREHRLALILTGFGLLFLLMVMQFLTSRPESKQKSSPPSEWRSIGSITLSGSLLVSDRWDSANSLTLDTPPGIYQARVLAQDDGTGRPMASGLILSNSSAGSFQPAAVEVSVDTGVLVLLDSARNGITPEMVKKSVRAMLAGSTKADGAVFVLDPSGVARGMVVESGWGDGIYLLEVRKGSHGVEIATIFT